MIIDAVRKVELTAKLSKLYDDNQINIPANKKLPARELWLYTKLEDADEWLKLTIAEKDKEILFMSEALLTLKSDTEQTVNKAKIDVDISNELVKDFEKLYHGLQIKKALKFGVGCGIGFGLVVMICFNWSRDYGNHSKNINVSDRTTTTYVQSGNY